MKEKSEFGKGLVVCLAKFYQHFALEMLNRIYFYKQCLKKSEEEQEKIRSENPPANLNYGRDKNKDFDYWMRETVPTCGGIEEAMSERITLWANGASDHLYEIEAPEGKEWSRIRKIIKELKEKGLNMGHSDGLMSRRRYYLEDVNELRDLTEKALLTVDKKLGLKPDWGQW